MSAGLENNAYSNAERLVRAFAKANNCDVMIINDDNYTRRSYRVVVARADEVPQVRYVYVIGGIMTTFNIADAFSEALESIVAHHHVSIDELTVIADIDENV